MSIECGENFKDLYSNRFVSRIMFLFFKKHEIIKKLSIF